MKWILNALVVTNLLMFGWFSQHQPSWADSGKATGRTAIPAGTGTISLMDEIAPVMKAAAETPQPLQSAGMCHIVGPFGDQTAADEVLAGVRELGREGSVRSATARVKTGYWVYLEAMPAQALGDIVQELKRKGIEDYHRNERNQLSLGIYSRRESAERRQQSIAALGYAPLVEPLFRNETRYWIDVRELDAEVLSDEVWQSRLADYPESRHQSERCTFTNA